MCKQFLDLIIANSVNTDHNPFQAGIIRSKFVIDALKKRYHRTLLICLFLASCNVLLLQKISRKFQEIVTESCPINRRSKVTLF